MVFLRKVAQYTVHRKKSGKSVSRQKIVFFYEKKWEINGVQARFFFANFESFFIGLRTFWLTEFSFWTKKYGFFGQIGNGAENPPIFGIFQPFFPKMSFFSTSRAVAYLFLSKIRIYEIWRCLDENGAKKKSEKRTFAKILKVLVHPFLKKSRKKCKKVQKSDKK